jgi:hypothetical protein
MRGGIAAKTALYERDWPHGGDAMRTHGTVRCSGCNHHDRNEGTDQEESKEPRDPSPSSHHRRSPLRKYATVAINASGVTAVTRPRQLFSPALADRAAWSRRGRRACTERAGLKVDRDLAEVALSLFKSCSTGREE